ncbi:MAG: nitrous oxide reductase accessory protein NosL [Thermodesulfobacteriota bacterium]
MAHAHERHSRVVGLAIGLALLLVALGGWAGGPSPIAKTDRCPVCGMFVGRYPDFAAQIELAAGGVLHFDGVKDLFKCYLGQAGQDVGCKARDWGAVWVRDYVSLAWIDGRQAFFVIGSDVFGPMGRELIPFAAEAAARAFVEIHGGTRVLRFGEITPELIVQLD